MANLQIFGRTLNNVSSISAYDTSNVKHTFTEGGGTPTLQSKTVTYSPSIVQQTDTVTADSGYDGLSSVNVTVDAVSRGTAGTPTATKGTVSNNSVSVTPSVTNVGGMIPGGTKTGTAVTVSASELVSGTKNITSSGTTDVTNYASASVSAGTEGTPTATKGTVSNHSIAVIPRVTNTTGYITGGTKTGAAVTVFASELVSGTKSITENGTGIDVTNYTLVDVNVSGAPTLQSKTVTPSGSTLTVSPDTGYDGLSSVTVNPIALKMGVELPAAELVQSFTYNKLIVADEGVTLPAYGTSAITLKSSANLTPTITLSLSSYNYYVLARYLSKPVYNTSTIAKGREEYVFSSCAYEIVSIPANTFVASSGKKYASQNTTTLPVGALNKQLYWTSTTALAVYNGAGYSCYQSAQTPSVSSASSLSPTLTLKSPILYMRGHTTYFPQAVWNTVTDIRYQYIIEVYRIPKNTYNLNGWGIFQQADHIINCAFSTLT